MSVQASIVIDFGASAAGKYLFAELDAEKNSNKTSFSQGDNVYFRVYADCLYTISVTSGGVVQEETIESGAIQELASFINSNQFEVTKKIKDNTLVETPDWFGADLGNIQKINNTTISLVTVQDNPLGICKIEYKSEYDLWKLTPPGSIPEEYAIIVLITCN